MGRHAAVVVPHTPHRGRPLRRRPWFFVAAAVVVLLVAGGITWAVAGSGGSAAPSCPSRTRVRVAVVPEIAAAVRTALSGTLHGAGGGCVTAAVTAEQPLETVGDLGALSPSALPQVWVPDSSGWTARASGADLSVRGSMASSPVVLATAPTTATALHWTTTAPSWGKALTGSAPVALPDLAGNAAQLAALAALATTSGGGSGADDAVVQAVLASSRTGLATTTAAFAAVEAGGSSAPVLPMSEQQVLLADRSQPGSVLAVYPSDGSPSLDYPVVQVGKASGAGSGAVTAVVRELLSSTAQKAVRAGGFRAAAGDTPGGGAPAGAGGDNGVRAAAPRGITVPASVLQALTARLTSLAKPSRLLTVVDVSSSMGAAAGDGTRVSLARDAATSALALLPDTDAGGLWDFAFHLQGDQDWQQLAPIATFGSSAGDGLTQRKLLVQQFDSLPGRLSPGGTALYDTTLAAVRAMRAAYDPAAVNSVVLITDGSEDDPSGISLTQLVSTLQSEADASRPVQVVAVGIGPDADMTALQQIAAATGGQSYQALKATDLQTVLFDALRHRS